MPKILYMRKRFTGNVRKLIETINSIIDEYTSVGLTLTVRQLYYQLVARDYIPNSVREYKKIIDCVGNARLAGLIDWHALEDRTRNVRDQAHWTTAGEIVRGAAAQFKIDKWQLQKYRPIVMIEKDALVGLLDSVCPQLDVPYFSCRGYTSLSELWRIGQEFKHHTTVGQKPFLIHLGDHDPSGIDMSRDLVDRLTMFAETDFKFKRIALNMPQVTKYKPPPNPAKMSDSRFQGYEKKFGTSSWELDALDPTMLRDLIRTEVEKVRDEDEWNNALEYEGNQKHALTLAARHWDRIATVAEKIDERAKKKARLSGKL